MRNRAHWRVGIEQAAAESVNHRELILRIVTYLRLCGWYVILTPRGGLPGQPGVPDLLAFKRGRSLAVEVKVGRDKLSFDQVREFAALQACGFQVLEARSLDDVMRATAEVLG